MNLCEKMAIGKKVEDFISRASERPKMFRFFSEDSFATNSISEKSRARKLFEGRRNKMNVVSILLIFAKMTITWPRIPSFLPGQSCLAQPMLIR